MQKAWEPLKKVAQRMISRFGDGGNSRVMKQDIKEKRVANS